jgi:tRNA threonylcarbamoyladenosine biosynthesis protein TsaB
MTKITPILAIETSQNACSTCAYFSETKFFEQSFELKHSHAEKLFDLIDAVTNSAGIEINNYKSIAVSSGPGSFTGLRIGMSAAKSIAYALSIPIIPVPTFEAFALQIVKIIPGNSKFAIANRVNSEELFYAKFRNSADSDSFSFVEELQIIKKELLEGKLDGSFLFGNALLNLPLKDKILLKNKSFQEKKNVISAPNGEYVAKWAERFGNNLLTYNYEFLEPNYLKDFIIKEKEKKL